MRVYRNLQKFLVEFSHWYIGSSFETIYIPSDDIVGMDDHELWQTIRDTLDPTHAYEVCTVMFAYVIDGKEHLFPIG